MTIKLTLLQNALHSLYHALEHLAAAGTDCGEDDRTFDHENHAVIRKRPDGGLTIYSGHHFSKPPTSYNYKFGILHLIQAMELLIKEYLHRNDPDSIFEDSARMRTISLRKGLRKLLGRHPDLLTPDQVALILEANAIRNVIEHYEFSYRVEDARQIAADFLAICNYLALRLFDISLVDEFSCDAWNDSFDPTGETMSQILTSLGPAGSAAAISIAELWQQNNLDDKVYLCAHCGARGASTKKDVCVICGAETNAELGRMIDELDALTHLHRNLRARSDNSS